MAWLSLQRRRRAVGLRGGAQAETLRIGGTGVALGAMRPVSEKITAKDPSLRVQVMPSLSTSGGIRTLVAGEIDIPIASRAPTAEEHADEFGGKAACSAAALMPTTPHKAVSGMTTAELPGLNFNSELGWPDGTPLKITLRLNTWSKATAMSKAVPEYAAAYDAANQRKGVAVAAGAMAPV